MANTLDALVNSAGAAMKVKAVNGLCAKLRASIIVGSSCSAAKHTTGALPRTAAFGIWSKSIRDWPTGRSGSMEVPVWLQALSLPTSPKRVLRGIDDEEPVRRG